MGILWLTLLAAFGLAYCAKVLTPSSALPDTASPAAGYAVKPNKLFVLFAMALLVLVAGLRRNIGDTVMYMHGYTLIYQYGSLDYILSHKEKGFILLQIALHFLSFDPQILVFTAALITNVLIILVLYRYAGLFEIAVYVYITSGLYITSMNGMRQFLASAILFAGTRYIMNGNWFKYMLVVLVAYNFHSSAIILIPIYFLVRRKAWTKTTFALLAVAILLVLGYNQISGALFDAVGDYGHYKDFNEGGANLLRVVVLAVPLAVAYFGRDRLRELFPQSDYIVNLSLLGVVFMVIATQNWIFARFIIYFGLYNVILISWVVQLFVPSQRRLVYYGLMCCYFVYFYYENVLSLGLIYRSDYVHL